MNMMFSDKDTGVLQLDKKYRSRVSEIFNVTLKNMGIEVVFEDTDDELNVYDRDNNTAHELNGVTYICSDYQFYILKRISRVREEILLENPVLTETELQRLTEEYLKKNKFLNGHYEEEIEGLELNVKKENEAVYEKIKAKALLEETAEIEKTLEEVTSEVNIEDV